MDWQPIATAPRDGSWFVVRCIDDTYEVGRYEPYMWGDYEEVGDGLYRKVQRQILDWSGFNNFHRATHWIALPAPPADARPAAPEVKGER